MTERPGQPRRITPMLACCVLLLSVLAASATPATAAAVPDTERQALVALYDQTGGLSWTRSDGWLGSIGTECSWYGVQCDATGTHVIGLDLLGNRLTGSIPPALGSMPELSSLELAFNQLSGVIPAEIAELAQLTVLHLNMNQLTGSIPPELGRLSNLRSLTLQMNDLSGPIPPDLGTLANLSEFSLANNRLSGSVPAELGALTSLTKLSLDWNQLGGTLPAELDQLVNLNELRLGGNRFEGEIPDLSAVTRLSVLSMGYNPMLAPAPVPESLRGLSQLSFLDLAGTNRTGAIPGWLDSLTNLQYLILSANSFSGDIPSLASLKGLFTLDLRINRSLNAGPVPDWLQANTGLSTLMLGATNRTGGIPPWIAQLPWLDQLDLGSNHLSGGIPAELGSSSLSGLILDGNELSGPIPRELMDLRSLYFIVLSYNALFSADADLTAFIDALSPGWQSTQTVAPTSVAVAGVGTTTVTLEWEPIAYAADSGRYVVLAATGGAYDVVGQTPSKAATSLIVGNLKPETTYSFVVKTVTDPHGYNANLITSGPSEEVTATTLSGHVLTLSQQGSGSGRIISTAAGIDCSGSCSFAFASGTAVTLNAIPVSGTFAGWSGACRGTGPCQVTMSADTTVLATFEASPVRTLSLAKTGSGAGAVVSSPAGIDCGVTCAAAFDLGSFVTLTATPAPDAGVGAWTGCDYVSGNSCLVRLNSDRLVSVAFNQGTKITGTITDAVTHAGISGVSVSVYDANFQWAGGATTDSSGTYATGALGPGTYRVETFTMNGYLNQTQNGVMVAAGYPARVDFALLPGGRISGTITDAASGQPLSGVMVNVYDSNGHSSYGFTSPNGNWATLWLWPRGRTTPRRRTRPATSTRAARACRSAPGRRRAGSISHCRPGVASREQ